MNKINGIAIPGSYMKQDPSIPSLVKIAQKTLKLLPGYQSGWKLIKLYKAATQVVAGTNYFFILETGDANNAIVWKLYIYEDLQGHLSLTKASKIK